MGNINHQYDKIWCEEQAMRGSVSGRTIFYIFQYTQLLFARSRSQIWYSKICITVQLHLSMLEQRYSADSTPCLGNGKLGCRHME